MKGHGTGHLITFFLMSLVYSMSFFSGGCESKPKRGKKVSSDLGSASATETSTTPASRATTSGAAKKVDEDQGEEDTPSDEGSGKDNGPASEDQDKGEPESPSEEDDDASTEEDKPAGQDKDKDSKGDKDPLPTLPTKPEKKSSEIVFSPKLMAKLCRMDHDGVKGDLDDVVERLMEKSDASAESLGDKKEYGYLTSEEITLIRPLIVKIRPNHYDHIEKVICDDYEGEGRIYNLEQLIWRINN